MKRFAIIFIIVAATAMIFSSCGKYEEGPEFSLLTKKARITGTWEINEMVINDTSINVSDFYETFYAAFGVEISNFKMTNTLEKDGTGKMAMSYNITSTSVVMSESTNLQWEFDDTKENLRIKEQDTETNEWGEWKESKILKLTNSECWVENTDVEDGFTITIVYKMTKNN